MAEQIEVEADVPLPTVDPELIITGQVIEERREDGD